MNIEWRSSPEENLSEVAKSTGLGDTQVIMTLCAQTGGMVVPVGWQQVGCTTIILCTFLSTLLEREARQIQLVAWLKRLVNVRQSAKEVHQLMMPPCTEEQELSFEHILLICRTLELVEVLKTDVAVADAIPCMFHRMCILVRTCRIWIVCMQEMLVVIVPVAVVTEVHLVGKVRVTQSGIHYFIITPVECTAPHV